LGDCICDSRPWARHIPSPGIQLFEVQISNKELVVCWSRLVSKPLRRAYFFSWEAFHRVRAAGIRRVSDEATELEILMVKHDSSIRWGYNG